MFHLPFSQKSSNFSISELTNYFNLALSFSENIKASPEDFLELNEILQFNNYSLVQLLNEITPDCDDELVRCKWRGRFERCDHLFQKIETSYGQCCSFNYKGLKKILTKRTDYVANNHVEYITSCGFKTGLSILLDPQLEDYQASLTLTPGFQILIHEAHDFPDTAAMKRIIRPSTFNKLHVLPQQTYATSYIARESLKRRKCYLPSERKLYYFGSYSQVNCLAECRSSWLYKKCGCALPYWPRSENWTVCGLEQSKCYMKYKGIMIEDSNECIINIFWVLQL